MIFGFDYATPSVFSSDREQAVLGLAANERRPVRFHGKVVREVFTLRTALRALGEVIWSQDQWLPEMEHVSGALDPIITVHPDRVLFEAFSGDQGAYASLAVDCSLFELDGEVREGTTNIDFTAWLWAALAEMRSSRETWLRIGSEGVELRTLNAGGRFEKKVDVPESWVRGFLQTQGAMAQPGTVLRVRPVDLLSAIRWLRYSKAKLSPRGVRFVFEPGKDAHLILEPWEKQVLLKGAEHNYAEPRVIRVWGRRKLKLLEPLLPFAEHVDIYLEGRGLPSFYAVRLPGMTFVLGASGTLGGFRESASFDLMGSTSAVDAALLKQVTEFLTRAVAVTPKQLAVQLGVPVEQTQSALEKLCRLGRAMYDVETRQFRHRELFEKPVEEVRLYPPDARLEKAAQFQADNAVTVAHCAPEETRRTKTLKTSEGKFTREVIHRDWRVTGRVADQAEVELVVNDNGRMIYGRCGCAFFRQHLMSRGPCEHLIALFQVSDPQRQDLPTSVAATAGKVQKPEKATDSDEEIDEEDDDA